VTISAAQWAAVRRGLADAGERFTALVEAADGARRATAHWTVADVAAHVATLTAIDVAITGPPPEDGGPAFPFPAAVARWRDSTVDTVHRLNTVLLDSFTERDPRSLTARMRADVARILDRCADRDPGTPIGWLGGSTVPLAGMVAHLTNEFEVHGWDVARAVRLPYRVPRPEAAQFFEYFVVGILRHGYGRLLETDDRLPPLRVAVEFRSRWTTPATLLLDGGLVTPATAPTRPDVRLTFDPVCLNLMLFGRVSRARAVLSGGLRVRGPRPWLLPAFLRKVRLPS
jgi:uncharacterized protein (TIGR03083 family)